MDDNTKKDESMNHFLEVAKEDGIAVSSVSDGHVFVIMKSHLVAMLAKIEASGGDKAIVFVKRKSMAN